MSIALSALASRPAPSRAPLLKELQSQVKSGKIDTQDSKALSEAITAIDAKLGASRKNASQDAGNAKARVESLIQTQVKSGALTAEQGKALSDVFSGAAIQAARNAPPPKKEGGPKEGGPPPEKKEASQPDNDNPVINFLKNLRSSLETTISYNAKAKDVSASKQPALIVDVEA
jgi:hypothetical protein